MNPPGRATTTMLPFWFETLVGLAPWLSIWFKVGQASAIVLGFVCGFVISQVLLSFSFGLNQWLRYRGVDEWTDCVSTKDLPSAHSVGVAKSLCACQILSGSLAA